MTLDQKLEAFRGRLAKLQQLKNEFETLKAEHANQTREDFGIAEEDAVSIENLVKFFLAMESTKKITVVKKRTKNK